MKYVRVSIFITPIEFSKCREVQNVFIHKSKLSSRLASTPPTSQRLYSKGSSFQGRYSVLKSRLTQAILEDLKKRVWVPTVYQYVIFSFYTDMRVKVIVLRFQILENMFANMRATFATTLVCLLRLFHLQPLTALLLNRT